jgi:hypothetical protein
MRTPVETAKQNLFSAEAALFTARQRLADAEGRFAVYSELGRDFMPSEIEASLCWWRQHVDQAERAVEDLQSYLQRVAKGNGK